MQNILSGTEDLPTSYDKRLLTCYDLALSWLRVMEMTWVYIYLWDGDEYGSLENNLKVMEKNAEYGGQPEILALVHVIEINHC